MSASDDQVMKWQEYIQQAINQTPSEGDGSSFIFEDLFKDDDWREFTLDLKLATSVTAAFKRRVNGYAHAEDPVFTGIRWTGNINAHGRTVNFERIGGD